MDKSIQKYFFKVEGLEKKWKKKIIKKKYKKKKKHKKKKIFESF